MYYNSIYSQLFNFIPRYRFEKIVAVGPETRNILLAIVQYVKCTDKEGGVELGIVMNRNNKWRLAFLSLPAILKRFLRLKLQNFAVKWNSENRFTFSQKNSEYSFSCTVFYQFYSADITFFIIKHNNFFLISGFCYTNLHFIDGKPIRCRILSGPECFPVPVTPATSHKVTQEFFKNLRKEQKSK